MINDILSAPAKCFHNSVRLNADWEQPDGVERFTIGSVAHTMFLEPEDFANKVVILHFDDWRTSAAKTARDKARANDVVPILAHQYEQVHAAREAFRANEFASHAFTGGLVEQSLFWQDAETGIWCRARPDFIADDGSHLCDYKTTSNADPGQFGRHAYQLGYHRRAAWYLEGYKAVTGIMPEHYWFVSQEVKAPYLVAVVELDMSAIEAGAIENRLAARKFAKCLDSGHWPGYRHDDAPDSDKAFRVGLPSYAYMEIDARSA